MLRNSTIQVKKRWLNCGHFDYAFSHNRCANCCRIESAAKRMESEVVKDGLSDLIADADAIFSKYVRMSAADKNGIVKCYICGRPERWQDSQCMHYISRACLYLRYDLRNCKAGCKDCNEFRGGNLIKYAEKLDQESIGITERLYEESKLIYKPGISEIRAIVTEYTQKLNFLK